ncbi:methyltransferase family protein [Cycloclasticus pugetii]|jgi:protein-S-isoprenylcysteine O-methyltransferase Ste14|uniref:methyltransferase family protein n=1 Tax=Cycloclasticus pugetii TaxID=34068 RepID=UPI00037D7F58|nr:isoprenylcysteine carboxylmethyltransferase family protein [Cycloclasticus pugetii]
MNKIVIVFLAAYFISFFGLSVIWRNHVVKKKAGANAFKLNNKTGVEAITGLYFKCLPLVSILVFLLYAFFPVIYQSIGPIALISHNLIQIFGMGIMVIALAWIVIAQSQMGASWRIGIDHDQRTTFIKKGLFRYSRNPIFVGIIFLSFGFFLVLPNPLTLTILMLDIVLIQIQVTMEEQFLAKAHGQAYVEYCQQVRRWI